MKSASEPVDHMAATQLAHASGVGIDDRFRAWRNCTRGSQHRKYRLRETSSKKERICLTSVGVENRRIGSRGEILQQPTVAIPRKDRDSNDGPERYGSAYGCDSYQLPAKTAENRRC
jgi:hypothetical protein